MQLDKKTIQNLKKIISQDYGKSIKDKDASKPGLSLLRITRLALNVQIRIINNTKN